MKKSHLNLLLLTVNILIFSTHFSYAQEMSVDAAVKQLNFFESNCWNNYPKFTNVRSTALNQNWTPSTSGNPDKPISWGVAQGADTYSLMITESDSISSDTCEVRGNASLEEIEDAFKNLYAAKFKAVRTGSPESSWRTPHGRLTIYPARDGRSSIILAK